MAETRSFAGFRSRKPGPPLKADAADTCKTVFVEVENWSLGGWPSDNEKAPLAAVNVVRKARPLFRYGKAHADFERQ